MQYTLLVISCGLAVASGFCEAIASTHAMREPYNLDYEYEQREYENTSSQLQLSALFLAGLGLII